MPYKLFDIHGNDITHHDLQDKGIWCKEGASKEEVFIEKFGSDLNLIINPEKEHNPYVPDLLNVSNYLLADLKTQNTPFFQAKSRFGYDPQYAAVFNRKDRLRYQEKYPDLEIYFAIDWQAVRFQGKQIIEVKPLMGIWYISFQALDRVLEKVPFHSYHQRKSDQKGNAKGSYILNLLSSEFTRLK